jgi:quinol monooxygenase YgiN
MAVRLVVTINAAPGKGAELATAFRTRCVEVMQEPGCEQFEVFQSVLNPTSWPCSNFGPIRPRSMCTPR